MEGGEGEWREREKEEGDMKGGEGEWRESEEKGREREEGKSMNMR